MSLDSSIRGRVTGSKAVERCIKFRTMRPTIWSQRSSIRLLYWRRDGLEISHQNCLVRTLHPLLHDCRFLVLSCTSIHAVDPCRLASSSAFPRRAPAIQAQFSTTILHPPPVHKARKFHGKTVEDQSDLLHILSQPSKESRYLHCCESWSNVPRR